ncbi:hypothetical protein TeGR_g9336 [Tetraparma gracilis]|uniref:Uncharacterized protein n=1 Tax=Tetraparma gracilis TaxID=2962635 RepID=A0ABQ6M8Y5_9STRA|nr:hypothetical protein TeGR_g9336 [Tetraparma gracilis]
MFGWLGSAPPASPSPPPSPASSLPPSSPPRPLDSPAREISQDHPASTSCDAADPTQVSLLAPGASGSFRLLASSIHDDFCSSASEPSSPRSSPRSARSSLASSLSLASLAAGPTDEMERSMIAAGNSAVLDIASRSLLPLTPARGGPDPLSAAGEAGDAEEDASAASPDDSDDVLVLHGELTPPASPRLRPAGGTAGGTRAGGASPEGARGRPGEDQGVGGGWRGIEPAGERGGRDNVGGTPQRFACEDYAGVGDGGLDGGGACPGRAG